TDWSKIADADIVVEAVFEEMPIKKEVFAKIDKICKPGAVLASNTSTLDVDEIASATARPQCVGVCYGFVGNRMLHQRGREAEKLILEGALPHEVDKVLVDFGFPMGPFAM